MAKIQTSISICLESDTAQRLVLVSEKLQTTPGDVASALIEHHLSGRPLPDMVRLTASPWRPSPAIQSAGGAERPLPHDDVDWLPGCDTRPPANHSTPLPDEDDVRPGCDG